MDKRGMEFEKLITWIIAITVMAIVIFGIVILKGRGYDLIDKISNIFRFGR
jgi:hypothetical protein